MMQMEGVHNFAIIHKLLSLLRRPLSSAARVASSWCRSCEQRISQWPDRFNRFVYVLYVWPFRTDSKCGAIRFFLLLLVRVIVKHPHLTREQHNAITNNYLQKLEQLTLTLYTCFEYYQELLSTWKSAKSSSGKERVQWDAIVGHETRLTTRVRDKHGQLSLAQ